MKKRLFATLLACAMTVSLVACGGSSSSSEKKEDTSDSKKQEASTEKEVLYRQNSFPVSSPEECLALHVGLPPGIPAGDLWHLMFLPLPDMPCLHSGYQSTMRS